MTMLRTILVPIDFSQTSMTALESARELAQRCDAELLVLHALELPVLPMGELPYSTANLFEDMEKAARKRLADYVDTLHAAGARVRGIFHVGAASVTILDCARKEQPDLIVMGSHGRRGVSRMFVGSVAERVVRASPGPVMTVRDAEAGASR
jgi:nucleotide-binding universal stress UspA family protein